MSGSSATAAAPEQAAAPPGRMSRAYAPATIMFENSPMLTGKTDYHLWRDYTEHVFRTMGCWSLVSDNEGEPTKKEGEEDSDYGKRVGRYRSWYAWASIFLLETVDSEWLPVITANKTPFLIWKALQDLFDPEDPASFHSQLASFLALRATSKSDLSSTITKFDSQWTRLHARCSRARSTDEFTLPYDFQNAFRSPHAKAAFLLNTLPPSMSNIKEHLMTNDNLTYEQCYQRLMDVATETEDDKECAAASSSSRGKSPATKECTWCAKHYPKANNKGHLWHECRKLKASKEKRKEVKDAKGKEEAARTSKDDSGSSPMGARDLDTVCRPLAPDTTVNYHRPSYPPLKITPSHPWIPSTSASSHMTII